MTAKEMSVWIVGIFLLMLTAEIIGGFHPRGRQSLKDWAFALTGLSFQTLVTPPLIALAAGFLLDRFLPNSANRYAHASFWAIFPIWWVSEEFCHYWLHRWS